MTDANFPMAPADMDDLPRTLRRERDRQRAAAAAAGSAPPTGGLSPSAGYGTAVSLVDENDLVPATVKRLDVPFFRLMFFLIKVVLAGIPALALLGALLWAAGQGLQMYFPELIQTKIVICSPNNPKGCP